MKFKKVFSLMFILILSILVVSGCSSNDEAKAEDEEWAENNGIFDTESSDELYEKAKEEGKVVVYSKGSKFKKVKSLFEEKYPGIDLESYKLEQGEMEEKLVRENDAEIFTADIVHVSSLDNLVEDEYIYPYKPEDIMENFLDEYKDDESPVQYFAINSIYYNDNHHDDPPVDNWWDLTEPEWNGRVLIQDPTSDLSLTEHFVSMLNNADEMEEAYEEKYGEELELTEDNAAYEFFKHFIENDPVMMSSSEDILDNIADATEENDFIGLGSSSKVRKAEEQDLPIAPIYEMKPRLANLKDSTVYIANHAPHPNAAKLLARFVLGEEDGEGMEPFNSKGVWIPQETIENKNEIEADELEAWEHDEEFYDEHYKEFRDYWISHID